MLILELPKADLFQKGEAFKSAPRDIGVPVTIGFQTPL